MQRRGPASHLTHLTSYAGPPFLLPARVSGFAHETGAAAALLRCGVSFAEDGRAGTTWGGTSSRRARRKSYFFVAAAVPVQRCDAHAMQMRCAWPCQDYEGRDGEGGRVVMLASGAGQVPPLSSTFSIFCFFMCVWVCFWLECREASGLSLGLQGSVMGQQAHGD